MTATISALVIATHLKMWKEIRTKRNERRAKTHRRNKRGAGY
jgi:hypothetical protein